METATPAASAPPVETTPAPAPTISASRDAANRGDFRAFQDAERAAREGKPLERVEAPADAAKPPAATEQPRQVSKRQEKTNDAIREAVDRATADLRAELDRVRQAQAPPQDRQPPTQEKQPPAAKPERFQTLAEYNAQHPDASLEDYLEARETWRDERQQAVVRQHGEMEARARAEHERIDAFLGQVKEANADATFKAAMTPEVTERFNALKPFGALQPGERGGPKNFIAEQIYDSPMVKTVLLHFAQHPEELDRLEAGPAQLARIPDAQRTDAHATFHLRWIEHEFKRLEGRLAGLQPSSSSSAAPAPAAAVPDTVTSAPPPPPTISRTGTASDPQAAAFARGDFATWNRIEREKSRARGHL